MAHKRSAKTTAARTAALKCPCGTGMSYATCCSPLHLGERAAATAEALMRSRYSAFAKRRYPYLLETWNPATRPDSVGDHSHTRWESLRVLRVVDGGAEDATGVVEFVASYVDAHGPETLHEISRFDRVDGRWMYTSGVVPPE